MKPSKTMKVMKTKNLNKEPIYSVEGTNIKTGEKHLIQGGWSTVTKTLAESECILATKMFGETTTFKVVEI